MLITEKCFGFCAACEFGVNVPKVHDKLETLFRFSSQNFINFSVCAFAMKKEGKTFTKSYPAPSLPPAKGQHCVCVCASLGIYAHGERLFCVYTNLIWGIERTNFVS